MEFFSVSFKDFIKSSYFNKFSVQIKGIETVLWYWSCDTVISSEKKV